MPARQRQQQSRHLRAEAIIEAARSLAERDGWDAVTTRRLSEAIDYSQPVLYGHFPSGKSGIMDAVALQGFERLASKIRSDRGGARTQRSRVTRLVHSYLGFADQEPAVYLAMFARPTALPFGVESTPEQLRRAYDELAESVAGCGGGDDPETFVEVIWSALHGMVMLSRDDRLRPSARARRIRTLVDRFVD
ncbi:TetR/AcrR family transcriptional regulator [Microlunatus soli]|uniref:DNA-binding transcriptional regulator, AcrR family n=1 Tax=Microlunatus soli TaxID=630515 RepID=A0A1H1Y617_9ACTN|nr:TetR/AcrR family transcriptional regulator [Microlunatus soli]SDT16476.1 DNA-binding transcriptional regulator, AcrR family [Microlunatus soli]